MSKLRTIIIAAAGTVAAVAAIASLAAVSYYRQVQFDPAVLSGHASAGRGTVFLDRRGRELRFLPDDRGERARWVPLAEIPSTVRNAFLAAEDERFFRHHGFDGRAILRALWSNVKERRIVSGASTITQQVVRLVSAEAAAGGHGRGRPKRSYRAKADEIIRSVKLEQAFSKEAILEQYLNRVPMGNNLVGVETAAQAYFGSSVRNLSPAEAALLASLPKAPGMLNPYGTGQARLRERRDWVLTRMAALGGLSPEEARSALHSEIRIRKLTFPSAAPHVVDMMRQQGAPGGIVHTTIDLDLQQRVQEILASHVERLRYRGATQAAAIVIHNPTMQVLAAVGSLEYGSRGDGFNNGVLAPRSAGSTLKPFLYALSMEEGETVNTLLEDTERTYHSRSGQYAPLNFDRKEYGPVTVRAALGSSLNLSAVRMLDRLGENRFYELLSRMRLINHPELGPEHYGLGMAIGNPEVNPEQLAEAYAMLANGGVYQRATYRMRDGRGPGSPEATGRQLRDRSYIFLPQTAAIITDILSDPTARMFTFSRNRNMMDVPFPIAIKTGTSTFFRDLWAAGYTQDHTIVVWAGNFDGSPTRNLSGSTAAMPIFSDIIAWLYRQSPPEPFRKPRGLRRVTVCGYSGMRPTEHCAQTVRELFIVGSEPRAVCTFHTASDRRHELAAPYAGWLFGKNRSGTAGRYRLAGFGDDLGAVFQDPWRGVADLQREPGVRARNVPAGQPAAIRESTAAAGDRHYSIGAPGAMAAAPAPSLGDREVRIIYPLDKDRFVRDRSGRSQTIKLQALVARVVPYVEWFVNGRLYQRTGPPYQVYWPLERGRFRLTAVTPENVGDSVQVTVE